MTSEKLMQLEIKKKQAKEAQIQNMKEREEAACAAVSRLQENGQNKLISTCLEKEERQTKLKVCRLE